MIDSLGVYKVAAQSGLRHFDFGSVGMMDKRLTRRNGHRVRRACLLLLVCQWPKRNARGRLTRRRRKWQAFEGLVCVRSPLRSENGRPDYTKAFGSVMKKRALALMWAALVLASILFCIALVDRPLAILLLLTPFEFEVRGL